MKKIGDVTSTADKNGEWTNGNVAAGIAPTILEAGWLNSVQREILGVIIAAGMQQDKNDDTQLSKAISKIISGGDYATKTEVNSKLAKDQNGADIPNKPKFIENLGLEERLNKKVDYGNHTITGGVDSVGNGSVNAANGGIRFYRKKDGTLTLFSREAADSDSGYVTEVELPKKKGMAALTSDLTNKIDYGIHVITGGVDSAGRGSVNAANGSLRVHRDASGVITIYGREQTDDTSEYVTAAAFPKAKGEVCLDVFTFAAGGAKYRDVKSQRKNGVTYTNTLPRPILVIASYDSPATRTLAYVDGVRVAQTSHGSPSATGAWGGFVSFIVPAGSKYIVNSNGDKIELLDWVEL
ncbi:hypothetical protein [Morganella morganii]